MALTKEQKQKIIEDLKEKVERQKAIAFIDFTGTKVKNASALRQEMKDNDCEFKVAKKTLLSIVFKERGLDLPENFQGEVALGFGYKDQILPFKILNKFAKKEGTIKFLGGIIDNELVGEEKAVILAELSSRENLLAELIGSIKAPISGFVNALQWNLRSLVLVLSAIKK